MKCNLRQFKLNSSCVYPRNVALLNPDVFLNLIQKGNFNIFKGLSFNSEFLHFLNHVWDVVISVFSTVPVLYGNDIQYGFDICFCKTKVSKEFSSTSCHSGDLRFYGKVFQIFNTILFLFFIFGYLRFYGKIVRSFQFDKFISVQ